LIVFLHNFLNRFFSSLLVFLAAEYTDAKEGSKYSDEYPDAGPR
jgi:hypothetical protein